MYAVSSYLDIWPNSRFPLILPASSLPSTRSPSWKVSIGVNARGRVGEASYSKLRAQPPIQLRSCISCSALTILLILLLVYSETYVHLLLKYCIFSLCSSNRSFHFSWSNCISKCQIPRLVVLAMGYQRVHFRFAWLKHALQYENCV